MKKFILISTLVATLFVGCTTQTKESAPAQPRKIAVQIYSLNRHTFEDAVKMLKDVDVDAVECFPGQKLSKLYPNAQTNYKLNAEQRAYMKKLLKDAGLKMVSFGCTRANNEQEIEKICQFVKEMGGERVVTEAPVYWIPFWNKICKKYGLTMCLHHHATNSANQYWDTDVMNKYIAGYDNVRANPDPGHWSRSGIDPVKALKRLDGKIASIHFKDQREFNNIKNQPMPFGEGVLDVKGMLAELDRQGYNGYFVIEYEDKWENNIPEIKKCVEYLRTH